MSHPKELEQWIRDVSINMSHLSKNQAMVLALYSFAVSVTNRCGLSIVSTFLSLLLKHPYNTMRQRLREWNYEASAKRGDRRKAIVVQDQFSVLLKWLLSLWHPDEKRIALAMDVTYLGERFTILAVSVLYGGCSIPVAWHIREGHAKGEWHPIWVELLDCLAEGLCSRWQVFVLTDRGLYSKRLFKVIESKGWIPIMRISTQGLYQRKRMKGWKRLVALARPAIGIWCHRVRCFKGDPLDCTLLVQWDAVYNEPCLIVTTLQPEQIIPNLYGIRYWIEAGFKDVKRGGFRWEQTKMTDPARVERLWIVLAVALIRMIYLGSLVDEYFDWLFPDNEPRVLSHMTLGWLIGLVAMIRHDPLPTGYFMPYDWHKAPT